MVKEIRYGGMSAQPNEYISEDGESALLMNLVPEKDGLQPMGMGVVTHEFSNGMKPLYIHSLSNYRHIIYEKDNVLYWADFDKDEGFSEEGHRIEVVYDIKNISAIGNTLVIVRGDSVGYAIWRGEDYEYLGSSIPIVLPRFFMKYHSRILDDFSHKFNDLPNSILNDFDSGNRDVNDEDKDAVTSKLREISTAIYGKILSLTKDNATTKGLFYQPFFVRTAIKLYDDSYVMHSAPMLMIPTARVPMVFMVSTEIEESSVSINSSASINIFELVGDFDIPNRNLLGKWRDIIQSIDVFISAPIYTWNQSKDMELPLRGNNYPLGFYEYGANADNEYFTGCYYDGENEGFGNKEQYIRNMPTAWSIARNENFISNVEDVSNYYRIASIGFEKLLDENFEFSKDSFETENFASLETLPTMPDGWMTNVTLVPSCIFPYNNRFNFANVEYFPSIPYPLVSTVPTLNAIYDKGGYAKIEEGYAEVKVWTKKEGKKIVAYRDYFKDIHSDKNKWGQLSKNFPRWIFYPDANAYLMEITWKPYGGGMPEETYSIPLKPHIFLNGAYWWGGVRSMKEMVALLDGASQEMSTETSAIIGNKLYTSEAENPWVFSPEGVRSIGDGDILGIAPSTKALSEGQFGQFPLYAFTTEGVWSLSVTSEGFFKPAQPITRDVCISADSITQLDQAVLFATDRGIMLLEGSNASCITDKIKSELPVSIQNLKGGDKVVDMSGIDGNAFNTIPFEDFIKGCSMTYDYMHQRIILYNKECSYAYVFSLESQAWGMIESNIADSLNSYPDAIVVTNDNQLVNLSKEDDEKAKGLMITRALKLDDGDVLKTINTIVQRGDFNRGDVATILWGSRDLKNWHLVWSSKDHYMRGFRGTPYKYYRIGAITNLGKDESLIGASINYEIKQTNQIR